MPPVNISHHVTQINQRDVTECWACSIAMITGRHSWESVNHVRDLAIDAGVNVNGRLSSADVRNLARATRLGYHDHPQITVGYFASLLRRGAFVLFGRFNFPGAAVDHAVAISALQGDGTPAGTRITINDPWGGVVRTSFQDFALSRNPPPILVRGDYIISK
ncbi:MAG TPA: papain-like cysteine protease family protein [Pyrinomonadaceae bacterium]|jgi:hypothetical protein|nr:papain-like cysteine protease family protein [Pyrinomonadaceae bacterium]